MASTNPLKSIAKKKQPCSTITRPRKACLLIYFIFISNLCREHGLSERLEHIVGIFPTGISCRVVIAHSERKGSAGIDVAQAVTHDSGASHLGRGLPDDLGEVTPAVKQRHERAGQAVQVGEEAHLIVVHQVGDHLANVALLDTVANVLTVTTAVNAPVQGSVNLKVYI